MNVEVDLSVAIVVALEVLVEGSLECVPLYGVLKLLTCWLEVVSKGVVHFYVLCNGENSTTGA